MSFDYFDEEFDSAIYALECVIASYEPISDYQEIFEADNPQVQQQAANNAQQEQQGESFVMKAIQAIKNMIKQMITNIKNFFQTLTMSKDEKAKYQAFLQKCKNDPQLKGKKITLTDYRKVNAEYEALIKEAETAISNMKEGQPTAIDNLVEKMKNGIKGVAKGASVVVTAEVIDKMAASNQEIAEMVYKKLREDERVMEVLEEQMGHAKARDFKARMRLFSSKCKLKQMVVKLRYKQYSNAKECVEQTFREMKGLMTGDPNYASKNDPNAKNNKWYKKGNSKMGAFTGSSVGIIGKAAGNQHVKNLAGGMANITAKNAAADLRNTVAYKLGITKDARYQKLIRNEPKRDDFDSESAYGAAKKQWGQKVNKLLEQEYNKIASDNAKAEQKYNKAHQGRNQEASDFMGSGNDSIGSLLSTLTSMYGK